MKLKVPLYINKHYDCGPVCLEMIFDFFGQKKSFEEIQQVVNPEKSGATLTIGLAKAAQHFGFQTTFYTKQLVNEELFTHEFYQEVTNGEEEYFKKIKVLTAECESLGVNIYEKTLTLKDITKKISEDCLAIIILDWGVIKGLDKYHGHFVVITGYDEDNIYVNQPGPSNPDTNMKISRELFDRARKAPGTDEDIMFIQRKNKELML